MQKHDQALSHLRYFSSLEKFNLPSLGRLLTGFMSETHITIFGQKYQTTSSALCHLHCISHLLCKTVPSSHVHLCSMLTLIVSGSWCSGTLQTPCSSCRPAPETCSPPAACPGRSPPARCPAAASASGQAAKCPAAAAATCPLQCQRSPLRPLWLLLRASNTKSGMSCPYIIYGPNCAFTLAGICDSPFLKKQPGHRVMINHGMNVFTKTI